MRRHKGVKDKHVDLARSDLSFDRDKDRFGKLDRLTGALRSETERRSVYAAVNVQSPRDLFGLDHVVRARRFDQPGKLIGAVF